MRKRITILLKNDFTRDSRVLKEAQSLSSKYDVTVIAIHKEGLELKENINGFKVVRLKLLPAFISSRNRVLIHAFMMLVFLIKSFIYGFKSNFVHCNDLEMLPVGVFFKMLTFGHCKVIYDAHEYEIERIGLSKTMKNIFYFVEYFFICWADSVITVSEKIGSEYKRLYGLKKVYVVMNTPYEASIEPKNIFREKFKIPDDGIIFIYQGVLGMGRNIDRILEVFKTINSKNKFIIFMGYGEKELEIKEAAANYSNIFFHPSVEFSQILPHTSSADVGICLIEGICKSYEYSLPNKLFEYFSANLPVICSDFEEMKGFVDKFEVGISAEWSSVDDIRNAVESFGDLNFYKKMKDNTRKIPSKFSWEIQELNLFDAYRLTTD